MRLLSIAEDRLGMAIEPNRTSSEVLREDRFRGPLPLRPPPRVFFIPTPVGRHYRGWDYVVVDEELRGRHIVFKFPMFWANIMPAHVAGFVPNHTVVSAANPPPIPLSIRVVGSLVFPPT